MSNPYKTIYELRETIAELSERCREQEAEIEELLKEREWISVKDRLPKAGDDVLVWFEYYRYGEYNCLYQTYGIGTYFDIVKSWLINGETGWRNLRVIKWMPLPEPPKEDDAE